MVTALAYRWRGCTNRYFGGNIHFQSMYGYGTDVYINLNHLGNVQEGLDLASIED